MKKLVFPLTILGIAIILAGGVFIYTQSKNKTKTGGKPKPIILSQVDDQFTLKATKQDSLGIDPETAFTLASKQAVSSQVITANLKIEPEFSYKVESSDNNTFTLIPKENLEANTVYSFSLAAQQATTGQKREYTWAYQIKDTFKVTSTLPRDRATNVPTNSAIEIIFSSENFTNYENFIDISPKSEGNFEQHLKTLTFIPKELKNETVYTVTIKKGLPVKDSTDTLAEDYIFRFETEQATRETGYLAFADSFYEYPAGEMPVLILNEYNTGLVKVAINVFKFNSFNEFADAVKTKNLNSPAWAYYTQSNNPYPTSSLQKITTFESDLKDTLQAKYLDFPDKLTAGYYLVEIDYQNNKIQSFLQISELTAAFQGSKSQSFIWLNDFSSKKPVADAKISFSGDSNFSAKSNDNGLAVFDTPSQMKPDQENVANQAYFFTATKNDQNLLIPAEQTYTYSWNVGGPTTGQNDYWSHLYTNRNLYKPTDSIKFWGVAKTRSGTALTEVKVKLNSIDYYGMGPGYEKLIANQTIKLTDLGTFQGEINFTNLMPGSYFIRLLAGDTEITSTYVQIQTYTKPAYTIEINTPKKAVFAGEDAVFDVQTKFFDGTPVAHLGLKYSGSFGEGELTTDDNGKAQVTKQTSYTEQELFYPQYQFFTIYPINAETTNISSTANLYVFGPHYQLKLDAQKEGTITGNLNEIDLTKMNTQGKEFIWDYQGKALADTKINLKIYEQYYQKTENGSYYDYINKITVPTYYYETKENLLKEQEVNTDQNGLFQYSYSFEKQKNYKIYAETRDNDSKLVSATTYLFLGELTYYGLGGDYYYLASHANTGNQYNIYEPEYYKPGEQVELTFQKNEQTLPENADTKFVYFKDHNGIFDVTTSTKPNFNFEFKESYAPNVYTYGIYFDGRSYHVALATSINMDKAVKKLNIQINPDKDEYAPSDKVRVDLTVTDKDNKPVVAEVNVSLIDEALAAIQWNDQTTVLDNLYRYLEPTVTFSYTTHKAADLPMAERGGCFTEETKILMADRTQKQIKDIKVGEKILTRQSEKETSLVPSEVKSTQKHLVNEYLTINDVLEVTPVHIVYLNDNWQPIGKARIGDYLRNSAGEKVLIEKITPHFKPVEVYNLQTKNHTFIANNIYVHNEKGGGRQNFQDVAYFNSVVTSKKGQAKIEFTLPDNITSWRTTVQAVTEDLNAAGQQTALIVTKPFFVDVSVANQYLTSDKPIVKIRGFGKGITESDTISYQVSYGEELQEIQKYQAKTHEPVEITLPEFSAGTHAITVKGETGNGLKDTLTKQMTFNSTNLTSSKVLFYQLEPTTKIEGNANGITTLTFLNKERGQFYNLLENFKWQYGDRLDQKIARTYSQKLLNSYFNETAEIEQLAFTDYQLPEGGISILPYSSAELLLTAKIVEIAADDFDKGSIKNYFSNILDSKNSNTDEIAYALFGLANLKEPVLTDITNFLNNQNPSPELKLYLARGIANLGAGEYAKTILAEIIKNYGEAVDPYLRINLGKEQDQITEYTYQSAILASTVSSPDAEKLFNYSITNPATYTPNVLEQLAYLEKTIPLLSEEPVSFSYTLSNKKETIALKNDETLSLGLNPQEVKDLSFSDISGKVGLIATYDQPLDLAKEKQDANLKIERSYSVGLQNTTTFNENDLVKITIKPTVTSKAIDNEYQITDYLPAGLIVLTDTYSRNIPYDQKQNYPYEINGQQVKFWTGKPSAEFIYYAIVVGKGEYKASPPTLQGFVAKDSKAYGSETTVTIK